MVTDCGISLGPNPGLDPIAAALRARAAVYLAANSIKKYGDAESGFIVVPGPAH